LKHQNEICDKRSGNRSTAPARTEQPFSQNIPNKELLRPGTLSTGQRFVVAPTVDGASQILFETAWYGAEDCKSVFT
jgi:hypothetical protein